MRSISAAAGLLCVVATLWIVGGSATALPAAATVSRCPTGKPPPRTITKIQSIQLALMRNSSFNNFDGRQVARDLLRHRRLWCGALMDRLGADALIKLRDIDENDWNVDTLYVLSSRANDVRLAALARHWHADAAQWVSGAAAEQLLGTSGHYRILEVWWD